MARLAKLDPYYRSKLLLFAGKNHQFSHEHLDFLKTNILPADLLEFVLNEIRVNIDVLLQRVDSKGTSYGQILRYDIVSCVTQNFFLYVLVKLVVVNLGVQGRVVVASFVNSIHWDVQDSIRQSKLQIVKLDQIRNVRVLELVKLVDNRHQDVIKLRGYHLQLLGPKRAFLNQYSIKVSDENK